MSEKEKKLLEAICAAVPKMSEFDKGYFLGKAESLADNQTTDKNKEVENKGGDKNG